MNKYIELHLHLDGAITPDIARRLAALQDIPLPTDDKAALRALLCVPEDCESLNDFLKCFDLPLSLMQTSEGIREAVRLVQENLKTQGVIYAELRFAPQFHCQKGLTQRQAVEAALTGLSQSDLPCNLILCCMRGSGQETQAANLETVRLAKEFLVEHGGVTALDLAGAEALFPTADFAEPFALARSFQIPFTIHAGEADGAASVLAAIRMGARRIGHGVRSMEDENVLAMLRDQQILLEMCPTSNRQTHAIPDMNRYPLKQYLDMGIPVAVCTDDMAICGTNLEKEFRYAEQLCGLTKEDELRMQQYAVRYAFTSEAVRQQLMRQLQE